MAPRTSPYRKPKAGRAGGSRPISTQGEAGTSAVTQPAGAGPAEHLNPQGSERGWQQTQKAQQRLSRSAQGRGPSRGSQRGPHWPEPGGRPESRSLASDRCSEPRKQTRGPAAETRAETSRLPPRRWSLPRVPGRARRAQGGRGRGEQQVGGRGPRAYGPRPLPEGRRPQRELTQPAQDSTWSHSARSTYTFPLRWAGRAQGSCRPSLQRDVPPPCPGQPPGTPGVAMG